MLHLRCPCGLTEGIGEARLCQVYICHCSMCPEDTKRAEHAGGAAWAAIPPAQWMDDSASRLRRTSDYAQRRCCNHCDRNLAIRYDCEAHTEWVILGALPEGAATGVRVAHIYAPPNNTGSFADGAPSYPSFEPWAANPDPCRPAYIPPPVICVACHRHAGCGCDDPRWLKGRSRHAAA
jgi:hypothetical protein